VVEKAGEQWRSLVERAVRPVFGVVLDVVDDEPLKCLLGH